MTFNQSDYGMVYGMNFEELSDAERDFANLLLATDTLWGGDAMHESGTVHFIADTWVSGIEPPPVYTDPTAVILREAGGFDGVPEGERDQVWRYVTRHNLLSLYPRLQQAARNGDLSPERAQFILNTARAVDTMLSTAISNIAPQELSFGEPTFEDKYRAGTTLPDVNLVDPTPFREELRSSLARAGYKVTPSRSLRETMLAWKGERGAINPDNVAGEVKRVTADLMALARRNLLPLVDFDIPGYKPDLSDVPFDGFEFRTLKGVRFTGSNIYRGGGTDRPKLKALFEYNLDHPLTPTGLVHLVGHEVMGHYLNSAVADLLWRGGKLPIEATMATMCTPAVAFQEGLAENMLDIIYGSRQAAIDAYGPNLAVTLAVARLESVGKHNASMLHQRDGMELDRLRAYIAEECVQSDPIVRKLSGGWATNPIVGSMYGPAYHLGTEVVSRALQSVGGGRVARIGFQTTGRMADIQTFQQQVYQ